MSDINERIEALKEAVAQLEIDKVAAFAEFGEKAISELRDNKEFAEDVEKIDAIIADIEAKGKEEAALLEEKEKFEEEEREKLMKRTCFSCNTVNPEDAAFCENCGSKLGEPPKEYCKACGFMNQPGMAFCGKCGNKLGED